MTEIETYEIEQIFPTKIEYLTDFDITFNDENHVRYKTDNKENIDKSYFDSIFFDPNKDTPYFYNGDLYEDKYKNIYNNYVKFLNNEKYVDIGNFDLKIENKQRITNNSKRRKKVLSNGINIHYLCSDGKYNILVDKEKNRIKFYLNLQKNKELVKILDEFVILESELFYYKIIKQKLYLVTDLMLIIFDLENMKLILTKNINCNNNTTISLNEYFLQLDNIILCNSNNQTTIKILNMEKENFKKEIIYSSLMENNNILIYDGKTIIKYEFLISKSTFEECIKKEFNLYDLHKSDYSSLTLLIDPKKHYIKNILLNNRKTIIITNNHLIIIDNKDNKYRIIEIVDGILICTVYFNLFFIVTKNLCIQIINLNGGMYLNKIAINSKSDIVFFKVVKKCMFHNYSLNNFIISNQKVVLFLANKKYQIKLF